MKSPEKKTTRTYIGAHDDPDAGSVAAPYLEAFANTYDAAHRPRGDALPYAQAVCSADATTIGRSYGCPQRQPNNHTFSSAHGSECVNGSQSGIFAVGCKC